MHFLVNFPNLANRIDLRRAAPIVFQIVHTPFRVRLRVLLFVLIASRKARARFRSRRRVNPEFQAFAVDIIGQRFHIPEILVGLNASLLISPGLPAVIHVHVNVTGFLHPVTCDRVGRASNVGGRDLAREVIPTVPAHRWRWRRGGLRMRGQNGDKKQHEEASRDSNTHG